MVLVRLPGVYRAQSDTALLARVLATGGYAAGCRVLDIGSGTGALALAAWRGGATAVTAVDVSYRSAAVTWLNTRLRGAAVCVRRGDLLLPVGNETFDLIVANPPYVPAATGLLPRHRARRSWDGGTDGRAILDSLCVGAARRLAEHGKMLLVHSAICGEEHTVARLAAAGLSARVVARAVVPFGPVMRTRAAMLEDRGLLRPGQSSEELVVVEGCRGS